MTKAKKDPTNIVGLTAMIERAANPSLVGVKGTIVNETKNTIIMAHDGVEKTIIKDQVTISINGKTIDGKKLAGKLEERIKK